MRANNFEPRKSEESGSGAFDVTLEYNDNVTPVCIGIIFDVDPEDQINKLQWREKAQGSKSLARIV